MNQTKLIKLCRVANLFTCLVGLLLSVYAVFVEVKQETDPDFVALCDINQYFACSKVFASEYGKGFGLVGPYLGEGSILNQPNGVYGMITYVILFSLSFSSTSLTTARIQHFITILSNAMTPYLAYIMYMHIHFICLVCILTYGVNLILLVISFYRLSALNQKYRRIAKKISKKE